MWLSVPCSERPSRENLAPVGVHRFQGKCGYLCLTSNALLRIAVYSDQDALLGIVSIHECPTPYSSMFCSGCRKCGYSENGIRTRTCGYTELSQVTPNYPECPTPNIGTIRSLDSYKILLRLEQREIRSCRKVGKGASKIRVGDVVVIEDVVPRHRWKLGVVLELLKGSGGYVRGTNVKVGKTKNVIRRPVNRLYSTEVRWIDPREQNLSHAKDTINDKINIYKTPVKELVVQEEMVQLMENCIED